jgi:hypothetical protein
VRRVGGAKDMCRGQQNTRIQASVLPLEQSGLPTSQSRWVGACSDHCNRLVHGKSAHAAITAHVHLLLTGLGRSTSLRKVVTTSSRPACAA